MKKLFTYISIIICFNSCQQKNFENVETYDDSECSNGIKKAISDANNDIYYQYTFGLQFFGTPESKFEEFYQKYIFDKYKVRYRNMGCVILFAHDCYNSKMKDIILKKYGQNFFDRIRNKAKIRYDSIKNTETRIDTNNRIQQKIDSDFIFKEATTFPQYVGGEDRLHKFLSKNIKNPNRKLGDSILQGTVYCQFVVEKDGSLTNFIIRKSLRKDYDSIVIKSLKKMPEWKPAKINNQIIRHSVILPIKFE